MSKRMLRTNRNETAFQLHVVTLKSIYSLLPRPHSAQSANENTTTYMECDSCWVPNEHNGPAREKNKDARNERAGKKQSTSKKRKSYKLIALDTINLSLVLTFIKLSLDLDDFQPACLSRNSPEIPAAFDAVASPFLRLSAVAVNIFDKNS